MVERYKAEDQQALDDLFSQTYYVSKLFALKVEYFGREEYIVSLHDSRLPLVVAPWRQGRFFEDAVRDAVLEGVEE